LKILYKKQTMVTLLAGTLLSPGLLSLAQERPKQPAAEQQTKLSDTELQSFAKAYVEYHKIRQKYEPQLKAAKDPQQSKKIQDEANAKVKDALAKQQLTPQEYNRVFTIVNNDETLRKKAMKLIEEERKKG
jgi:Domain of unknown function (DUF4168)